MRDAFKHLDPFYIFELAVLRWYSPDSRVVNLPPFIKILSGMASNIEKGSVMGLAGAKYEYLEIVIPTDVFPLHLRP